MSLNPSSDKQWTTLIAREEETLLDTASYAEHPDLIVGISAQANMVVRMSIAFRFDGSASNFSYKITGPTSPRFILIRHSYIVQPDTTPVTPTPVTEDTFPVEVTSAFLSHGIVNADVHCLAGAAGHIKFLFSPGASGTASILPGSWIEHAIF